MNLRDIKKHIEYVIGAFVDDCALFLSVHPGKNADEVANLIDGAVDLYNELRDKLGLNGIRFHDLRHYFASSAAVLGIPDIYTADMGGWQRGGSVMKSVYQNNITSMSEYYSRKIADHMDGVISGSR